MADALSPAIEERGLSMFTNTTKKLTSLLFAGLMAAAVGCASDAAGNDDGGGTTPQPGDAFLTVVGDQNVFMENGWTQRLSVRYHDGAGEPLAGQVSFRISGVAGGANLLATSGVTNADGIVQVDLSAGAEGDAVFKVYAEAAEADAAEWDVAVSAGAPPLPPLDATGRYSVQSQFDIVGGLPGTAGDVVNGFLQMTDGPYDPATFVLDLVMEEVDSGFIEDLIDAARPALDGILNDLIKSYSPDIVLTLLDIGDKLGQITREFGIVSTLDVQVIGGIEGDELGATHVITGVKFRIDGTDYAFALADYGMENIVVEDVPVLMANETNLTIGEHSFTLSYGSLIMLALEQVIIPSIDPFATNLNELLEGLVDCTAVGVEIADFIGFGSPGLYEGACEIGLAAASSEIENQIRSIDGAGLVLTVSGDAKPQDTNTDRKVDVLFGGLWEGTISYAGTPAALVRPDNTFRGERMAIP